MKNNWLETRKEVFLRDLFRDFLEAKTYFDTLCEAYKKSSKLPYSIMDSWIGTETRKGPLWNLKDQCHRLFRNDGPKDNLFEYLFDWTVGSIFHEAIKLKEDAYQLEAYKPLLELEAYKQNQMLSRIIEHYVSVIERAGKDLEEELDNIRELFSKALFHLQEIFPTYKANYFLIRFLLDNQRLVEKSFGKGSFKIILQQIFPEGMHMAYVMVGESCLKSGRNKDADIYLQKAIEIDPENKHALELLQKLGSEKTVD